ncbi:Gfo/Idh/MocA family protein [Halorussus salinisoli]|uniref:Gfo/Idh/MocA family protein n=1 Tax=Halorussus salinisoli TaxID=2558242 RepID=UPI0010C1C2B8|nr:Gfo/Idh/MocA family oxidoreductase [Halorussus salinisoli]
MTLSIGLAGTGFMGQVHSKQYAQMDDVTVTAVSAPSGPDDLIEEYNFTQATAYTDTTALLAEADVDFLDVCTPTDTHLSLVRAAVEADVDVFLEKPIAGSLEEALEIDRLTTDEDVTIMVGHVLRYFPQYQAARKRDVGTPGVARTRRLSPFPEWGSDDWYADRDRSGGVFLDLAIHDIDYLRWCWGEVEEVFARRHRKPRAEHGFVTLKFVNGAVGYVEASWAQPISRELTMELELAGDSGLVEFNSAPITPYREWTEDGTSSESPLRHNAYYRELEHFVQCLRTGAEPDVTAEDAIEALRLSIAARQSARRNKPVSVEEVA